ncbi:MAG: glycosyltransferase family 1 protein [Candidatus Krumholzibacteriia bacterium]
MTRNDRREVDMRFGVALRTVNDRGGIGVYTRYIVEELLAADGDDHYVLFYRSSNDLGRFAHHPNVTERVVKAPNRAVWDQVAVPWACCREKVDLLFHPKFTVPLLARCKTAMVLHGADQFIPQFAQYYHGIDVLYHRTMMPLYCRKATTILSVSELTTMHFNRIFGLPPGKVKTVYLSPARHFARVEDPQVLEAVRQKYRLPERFILTLSGHDRGRRKNIDTLLEAYRLFHGRTPHRLVVGGQNCHRFKAEYDVPDDGWGGDVLFPGWIEQSDLPAVYTLADLYLYPSNVEAFPIPLTEAMACGTPIVTSNANGLAEIAGDAAVLVDPENPAEIAAAIRQVIEDPDLQRRLSARGLIRSRNFSWDVTARETLAALHRVG